MITAAIRILVVAGLAWLVLAGLSRVIRLAPDWPLPAVAVVLALAVEAVVGLTRYEAGAVSRKRARWILGLRLTALAALAWILLEPAWVRTVSRTHDREVVIVYDDSASMHLTDDGSSESRLASGRRALTEAGVVDKLEEDLRVRTLHAARTLRGEDAESSEGWRESTDLRAALNTVLEQVPPDELGGVVLVSDGRHNRPGRVEEIARRFGILDAPIAVLAVGSPDPPRDAAVVSVHAPEAIHLGDRMHVRAEVKFDGYRGREARVRLLRGGERIEERTVSIPQDHHREEVRFAQVPEAGGVGDFRIELEDLGDERFAENNSWEFETSITDARTNVLLVDNNPRWEFRYLRNLFYGRDKSVHLQWLLLNPDRMGGENTPPVPASAARPFGDAQATLLPESEEEWRKFDVIILGDLPAQALTPQTWETIQRCVRERAALLVLVAGPESMPHALPAGPARELVPVEVEWGRRTYFQSGGDPFRWALAPAGLRHPVTQQTSGAATNDEVWSAFPPARWRHPVSKLKEGAEVLLVSSSGDDPAVRGPGDLSTALTALANRRQRETESALLVTRQSGRGKVALLLTDRTWRLREGSGDIYHHRFWGNLVRWGAGPTLRAGGKRVRLGTDRLAYTPDDRITISARLREKNLEPVSDAKVQGEVLHNGRVVATVALAPVEGSAGLHEGVAGPFREAGKYEIRLAGGQATRLMAEEGLPEVAAGFRVAGSPGPVELADTTLNLPLLETVAELSGGKVFSVDEAGQLAPLFLGDPREREEVRETLLWNHWLVLILLAGCLAAEWVIRRGGGLP